MRSFESSNKRRPEHLLRVRRYPQVRVLCICCTIVCAPHQQSRPTQRHNSVGCLSSHDSRVSSLSKPNQGVFTYALNGASRAVGTHYGPTRPGGYIGPTMLREYVGRTTSQTTGRATGCTMDHATDRATQLCTPDQRQLLRHRAVGPADVQRWIIHMELEAPRPWCAGSNDPDLHCRGSDEVC